MWGHLGNVQVTKGQLSQMSLLLIEKNAQVGWGSAGGKRDHSRKRKRLEVLFKFRKPLDGFQRGCEN